LLRSNAQEASMAQKIWVAVLTFAVCFFAVLGLIGFYLWVTHRIDNREGLGCLIWSIFTVSSSYGALRTRINAEAAASRE
jgi:hypothetical protein